MACHRAAASSASATAPAPPATATVFGIDVCADRLPPVLARARAAATGRRLRLDVRILGEGSALDWPDDAQLISEQLAPDGSSVLRIEAHPAAGYLIGGAGYGTHRLSGDGRQVACSRRGGDDDGWERLLIAQVLPFAALLHGLEVFHASAVVAGQRAVALAGPSRAGKSSVAYELCRRGAAFLADDVLALERSGEELLAHAGAAVTSLDPAGLEADAPHKPRDDDREVLSITPRERLVRTEGAGGPAPLAALFLLDRHPDGPSQPRFQPVADARLLLAATFNFVLAEPERLRRLLDVCALAAAQRVERVSFGAAVDAAQLAVAIDLRLGGLT